MNDKQRILILTTLSNSLERGKTKDMLDLYLRLQYKGFDHTTRKGLKELSKTPVEEADKVLLCYLIMNQEKYGTLREVAKNLLTTHPSLNYDEEFPKLKSFLNRWEAPNITDKEFEKLSKEMLSLYMKS